MIELAKHSKKFTVEEFQDNFDILFSRVENGESFIITSEYGDAVICPYSEFNEMCNDVEDDIVRIHTTHEDAS